jgi:hypothetical protein
VGKSVIDPRSAGIVGVGETHAARHRPAQRLANTSAMPPPRDAINQSLHIIAGLWNLKTHKQSG